MKRSGSAAASGSSGAAADLPSPRGGLLAVGRRSSAGRLARRWFPVVLLPALVALLQPHSLAEVPLLLMAGALGAAIAMFFLRLKFVVAASFVCLVALLSLAKCMASEGAVKEGGEEVRKALRGWAGLSTISNLSVVLPCAFEGEFAGRTVKAILENTKHRFLHEIIVVDDGSRPPLSTIFPKELLREDKPPFVRIIRHEVTKGLIGAKKAGGDFATGEGIVFFDCHVSPNVGWEEAFLRQMTRAGDHRTVVVPTISTLDPDTWKEVPGGLGEGCYILWNADFTWLSSPGRDVPMMSGGLLAISRQWWYETGGYDEHMQAWGGENIDQSLRSWLCGGRIELARGATIAHMWRDAKNPKTVLHYPIPTRDVMRNKARVVTAWFGEFKDKIFSYPEYEQFTNGENDIGDMSNFDALKQQLQCRPYVEYLKRFDYVYVDGGLLPDEVYQLRELSTGLCLERVPDASQRDVDTVQLAPCAGGPAPDLVHGREGISEKQLWHPGNRDRKRQGKCCSGLMQWNFLRCIDAQGSGSRLQTSECHITGHNENQRLMLGDSGQLEWRHRQGCVGFDVQSLADAKKSPASACSARVEPLAGSDGANPEHFTLRVLKDDIWICAARVQHPKGERSEEQYEGWALEFKACDKVRSEATFHSKPMLGGFRIAIGDGNFCLDAAGGQRLLIYPCYEETDANYNQVWAFSNGLLVWSQDRMGYCVDSGPPPGGAVGLNRFPLRDVPTLTTCAVKRGQTFAKSDESGGEFLVHHVVDGSVTQDCLCRHDVKQLILCPCERNERWTWQEVPDTQDRGNLRHAMSGLCVDNVNNVPRLQACRAAVSQSFKFLEKPGWFMTQGGWADNGRIRYFEMCLDLEPSPLLTLSIHACSDTEARGIRWEKLGTRVPPETLTWREASSRLDPALPWLGGSRELPRV